MNDEARRPNVALGALEIHSPLFRCAHSCGADVHQLWHAGLHLEGHFILRDARGDLRVVAQRGVLLVERVDRGHVRALSLARDF